MDSYFPDPRLRTIENHSYSFIVSPKKCLSSLFLTFFLKLTDTIPKYLIFIYYRPKKWFVKSFFDFFLKLTDTIPKKG
jgi:hypothetical protein